MNFATIEEILCMNIYIFIPYYKSTGSWCRRGRIITTEGIAEKGCGGVLWCCRKELENFKVWSGVCPLPMPLSIMCI
jgi:hypothetical protein